MTVVNQPMVYGWDGATLYQQAYPALEDDKRNQAKLERKALQAAQKRAPAGSTVDAASAARLLAERRGIALPVAEGSELNAAVAAAPQVENRLPDGATWSGSDQQLAATKPAEEQIDKPTDQ